MAATREVMVGKADAFPIGKLHIIKVETREVGLVRRADGSVQAVRNWCPHKGAPICKGRLTGTMLPGAPGTLTWAREGELVRCPWHGFEFDMATGERPYVGSRMRLRVYPAKIRDGEIWLDLGPMQSREDAP
jgi:nitrite reductase (NADH) small subunit